jgi:hypothetical protein
MRMNLKTRRTVLEELKAETTKTAHEAAKPVVNDKSQLAIHAIAQYARKKGVLAARALRDGRGDVGHVRDLGDAALFGSATAAVALAELALNATTDDKGKQRSEGLAWLNLAMRLDGTDTETKERAESLRAEMSKSELYRSKDILSLMAERRAILPTRPYD